MDPKNVVAQKISVVTVNPKVMTLHGAHALVIIFDTQAIVSPWAHQPIFLKTSPLVIVTTIVKHTIVVIVEAALQINMITEYAIASQLLATARAKVTMPNTLTNPDKEHNHNQGPVLVILEPQDTIMVTIFIMMTPGECIQNVQPLLSLGQDWNIELPLLEPNLLLLNINTLLS